MKIIPLAAESLGVRSMAVYIETPDMSILADPGISLAPKRYGLEPHRIELAAEKKLWKTVLSKARKADVLTISHYHFDHHDPERPRMFSGRNLIIKHPKENINRSQRDRSANFLSVIKGLPESIQYADGSEFELGNTSLIFSKAVPHGKDTQLGYVVELAISRGKDVFLHTSDVEGPSLDSQLAFILEMQPTTIACDGPMTYLMYKYGNRAMERSLANLERVIRNTPVKTLMLDHHLARDLKWRERVAPIFAVGEETGCEVTSFAGYLGKEDELLEARRKELVAIDCDK